MDKSQIVQTIQAYFADKPVERAWLFGSFARNEQESSSMDLEKRLNRKVDLVCEGTLSKYVVPFANQDKQLIYER